MPAENNIDIHLPPLELLQLLADGKLHSGQELANILGVSRTAIWKQLAKLEPLGLCIESQPGKGYCLVGGLEFLDSETISKNLDENAARKVSRIEVLKKVNSTNAYLMELDVEEKIIICLSEYQSAGRGRRGRHWVSPFAKNIYLSVMMSVDAGLSSLEGLSLAVGVAVTRSLHKLGVENVQLKWPNDVLWCGRKLAGVLVEAAGDPSGRCKLVVGVGLNLVADKSMQMNIDQPWVSVEEINAKFISRNRVAAELINQIVSVMASYEREGFSVYKCEWESLNAQADQLVDLHFGESKETGYVVGVSDLGALILQTENGEKVFHGGEMSLRVAV